MHQVTYVCAITRNKCTARILTEPLVTAASSPKQSLPKCSVTDANRPKIPTLHERKKPQHRMSLSPICPVIHITLEKLSNYLLDSGQQSQNKWSTILTWQRCGGK